MHMKMKKTIILCVVVLLLSTSLLVMAKPEIALGQLKENNQKAKGLQKEKNQDAPGRWKKTTEYENQEDFIFEIHMRIWNRLSQSDIKPPGLMRLLGFSDEDGPRDEPIEDPIEEPDSIDPPLLPVEGEPMD